MRRNWELSVVSLRLRRIFGVLALIAAVAWPIGGVQAAAGTPSDVVARLNASLLSVMRQATTLGYTGRFDALAPELLGAFNFPYMASVAAGKHWRDLDEAQRQRLIDVFGRTSIANFADRFNGYSGETFEILGESPGPRDSVLVRNKLTKSDGESVEINYLMRQFDGRWQAIDVFLDAKYSELALKRSEYSSVIANKGFDSLIRSLEDKLAQLAAEG